MPAVERSQRGLLRLQVRAAPRWGRKRTAAGRAFTVTGAVIAPGLRHWAHRGARGRTGTRRGAEGRRSGHFSSRLGNPRPPARQRPSLRSVPLAAQKCAFFPPGSQLKPPPNSSPAGPKRNHRAASSPGVFPTTPS
ncbi:uncharacterized protein LOC144334728 [Macaca mulatta]